MMPFAETQLPFSHRSFGWPNVTACIAALILSAVAGVQAQTLQITYGSRALQTLSFGVGLEDVGRYPGDAFHIFHMKSTDLSGKVIGGWGESNNGVSWDAVSKTMTYNFAWGSINTQFVQSANNLDLVVTEKNNSGSNIIFDGAEIYPFALHFPQDPAGFSGYSQLAITSLRPGVTPADFGSGIVTAVLPDETVPMYGGWKNVGADTYSPAMVTTAPDGLPPFLPAIDHPVPPGTSFTYRVSLRFTTEGTSASASDAYSSFAATYPSQMTWTDKRIIGTAYLASSPPSNGDATLAGGFPTNPRRYFNDPSIDITTPAGLMAFQNRILAQAKSNVANAQALLAQGVITWDVEGEQYPQATSYVCSPDQIASVSPEMESIVGEPSSPYFGQKLDDSYFETMTSAGLKVGLCLRPQVFRIGVDGTATQSYLSINAAIIANLETKARVASARWGATIFYVDSTVDIYGGTLDPAIFQQLITDLPSFLFIPEESTPRYYAYSAPFYTLLFHGDLGTPASTYNYYPKAFGANLINDTPASILTQATPQLIQAVTDGDILMGHADWWQPNDPTLVSIYQTAGGSGGGTPQTLPAITWPAPSPITFGTALSSLQLNAAASTLGSFVYVPAIGTIPPAGTTTLMTTFTPGDSRNYMANTASVGLTVNQAQPSLSWPTPGALSFGSALGPSELNASANVAGTFTYNPAAGTVLSEGSHPLQVTFNPADATDYSSATASVMFTVNPATGPAAPVIAWSPAPLTYGNSLGSAQLNATSSAPGTFYYTPGYGTVLRAGANTLSETFIPLDTSRFTSLSTSATLVVAPANPVVTWPAPAPITVGTPLTGSQLNAWANVPGTFTYTPGPGTFLPAGVQTLLVSFAPSDSQDETAASTNVPITVNGTAASSKLAITYPGPGTTVSGSFTVQAVCSLALDSAGTYLMVDGVQVSRNVAQGPFVYPLDTSSLTNGAHTLQLWGHDIGNNTTLSAPIPVIVLN